MDPVQPLGQPPQQQPMGQDPLSVLMGEYQRLKAQVPKPMFTPEQAQSNVEQNNSQSEVGLLGALSGDRGISGAGGSVFKQAMANRNRRPTKTGIMDPLSGETFADPNVAETQRQQQMGSVLKQALGWQEHRTAAEERDARAREAQEGRLDAQRERLESNRVLRLALQANKPGPQPRMRMVQTADGYEFVPVEAGPVMTSDGVRAKPPPKGGGAAGKEVIPTGLQAKLIANETSRQQIEKAKQELMNNPDAVGLQNILPDSIVNRIPGNSGKGGTAARAAVADVGSLRIHDRSGAAVSVHEFPRLAPFIPSARDSAEVAARKLDQLMVQVDAESEAAAAAYPTSTFLHNLRAGRRGGAAAAPDAPPAAGAGLSVASPAAGGGAPAGRTRLRLNPATGELEPVQ